MIKTAMGEMQHQYFSVKYKLLSFGGENTLLE
jgi:hypothetical protein